MNIQHNFSLKPFNTFSIDAIAKYFANFTSEDELSELLEFSTSADKMILGGGSNILLTKDFDGYVLKNEIKGMEIVSEYPHHAYVRAGAGKNWHSLVEFCIDRNLAGMENLSLIPGNVGASPMQNIGAYGVELKDVFHELEAFHLKDRTTHTFSANDCNFGYRESVFKNKYKGEYSIMNVVFRLNKVPRYNTSYGAIEEELEKMGSEKTIRNISRAVINIRRSKLPDPKQIGNAGSFFKNPVVTTDKYASIKEQFPNAPGYAQENGSIKLAAGWLIEQCGWKGYRKGDAGVHEKQALVLVNYGIAKGKDIYDLSSEVSQSVMEKFGVTLEREVNII